MWWFILGRCGTSGTSKDSVVICLKTTWYVPDDGVFSYCEDCHAMIIVINGDLYNVLQLTVNSALMKVLSSYAKSFVKNFNEQPVSNSV